VKAYTIKDLETFERDEYGRLICPSGDYTQIKSFGERCSFGKSCSFGKCCSFGESCSFGERCSFGESSKFENIGDNVDRILKIDRIGSRNGCTYFFKTLSDIYVRCGCFLGTIAEFENKVKETHKDNPQYLLEYTEAIRYAKVVLGVKL